MSHQPSYTETELKAIEKLLSSHEEDVQRGLNRIQSAPLPERLSIALYNVLRFYDHAEVVSKAYDLLAAHAGEPLRGLIQQYQFLRLPDEGGDETTRKTLYAYLEQEADFDSKLYVSAVIRIMRFFCQRALGSLQDMMEEMGMDPDNILIDDPFMEDLDINLDDLDLELNLDEGLFTIANETAYLNNSHRSESYTALDFTTKNITHLQVYPSSVLMDVDLYSRDLAGIQQLTLIEADRPLALPSDLAEAPHLTRLALHNIQSYEAQAWEVLEGCSKIQDVELQLPMDHTQPPAALFELSQLTTLHLEGAALRLDFPIVLLGNLQELHIGVSTLEGSEQLFRQLKTLHHLERIDFHPALERAYQAYQRLGE